MISEADMEHGHDYNGEKLGARIVTEKLNGCRAWWDGARFWTRGGNIVNAPVWFTAGLPAVAMDGEIWAGRDGYELARQAVQYGKFEQARDRILFVACDVPSVAGSWRQRIAHARTFTAPHLRVIEEIPVAKHADIWREFARIKAAGGEGLMLRKDCTTAYTPGRTRNLLKIKERGIWD